MNRLSACPNRAMLPSSPNAAHWTTRQIARPLGCRGCSKRRTSGGRLWES
jgi:hypothetical protein